MKLRCQSLPALMRAIGQLEEATGADFCTASRRRLDKYVRELTDCGRRPHQRRQQHHQPLFQDRAVVSPAASQQQPQPQQQQLLTWDGTPHVVAMTEYRWCAMRAPKTIGRNRTQPALLVHRRASSVPGVGAGSGSGCGTGCAARVTIKAVLRFPQYSLPRPDKRLQSLVSHRLRYLMSRGQYPGEVWYYAYFPAPTEHNHPPTIARGSDAAALAAAMMSMGDPADNSCLLTLDSNGRLVARQPPPLLTTTPPSAGGGSGSQSSLTLTRQLDMAECVVRSEDSFLALLHRLLQQQEAAQPHHGQRQEQLPASSSTSASSCSISPGRPAPINWHSAASLADVHRLVVDLDDDCEADDCDNCDEVDADIVGCRADVAGLEATMQSDGDFSRRLQPSNFNDGWKSRRGRPLKDPLLPRPARLTAAEARRCLGDVVDANDDCCTSERLEAAEARIGRLEGQVARLTALIGCNPTS